MYKYEQEMTVLEEEIKLYNNISCKFSNSLLYMCVNTTGDYEIVLHNKSEVTLENDQIIIQLKQDFSNIHEVMNTLYSLTGRKF